ncbi:MAG: hypothetical protein DWC02_03505, partial [Candidatus Poseidoniales archaeon]
MRRSQSTLLLTVLVVSGLFFVSQLPAISNVATTNPNLTDGEQPPATDSDGDNIPDVHENLFNEWINFTSTDGRDVIMKGLDRYNASDAFIDIDIDGLNATEEYCWPYPAECVEPGFVRGLTGVVNESGERWYLDPRKADTDGDGMPDGFEVHMCDMMGGFDEEEERFVCESFDPLNSSDADQDPDEDGFDVDRNGFLTVSEMLTSPEEYLYGAPSNWTNELDGLRCYAPNPESSVLTEWPFITEDGNFTRLTNIIPACARNGTANIFDEYIWLGTNPLEADSDRFNFDGVKNRRLYPSSGDGISDGWEIHFGLDPLNRSNALIDLDDDGWDANRDGILSVDAARSPEALAVGEQLSTLEEYFVHLDDENTVKSGMRSVELGSKEGTYTEYLLTPEAGVDDISILNHDVREIIDDGTFLWVGTKLGITVIDFEESVSVNYHLPQGHDLHDMILLDDNLVMFTESGTWIAGRDGGVLDDILQWSYFPGRYTAGAKLATDSGDDYVIGLGYGGFGSVFQINELSITKLSLGTGISNAMSGGNATATVVAHADVAVGGKTLFVGTDVGMFTVETSTARDEA